MTTVDRIAKGLFVANLITAAERNGFRPPCDSRLSAAWHNNPLARDRWRKVTTRILAEVPGLDLGAMTGEVSREHVPLLAGLGRRDPQRLLSRYVDLATFALIILGAFGAGVILTAFVFLCA